MAKLLKLRRGTTTQHASFTGAEGEVTIDTTKDTAVVHDGAQAGGRPLAREDMSNVSSASIAGRLGTDSISVDKIAAGTLPNDVKVNSNSIINQAIINEDVSNSANIANSKLADSGVTAGAYGSSSAIPIVTVNAKGVVTAASTTAIDSTTIANGSSSVSVANNGSITSNANHDFSAGIDITAGHLTLPDQSSGNGKIKLGAGNDLQIYHDGSNNNSYIQESGSGNLVIGGDMVNLTNAATTESYIRCTGDAQVELYHNNNKKFETTNGGIHITGSVACSGGASNNLSLPDNGKAKFGTGDDIQIYHDGTDSFIDNSSGSLYIRDTSGGDVRIQGKSGENSIICHDDDGVHIYYDNSVKLTTESYGVNVTGNINVSGTVDGVDIAAFKTAFDEAFPSGTKMLFQQTSAPTGWTKITSGVNNKALRVVSGTAGSGGNIAFTTVFAARGITANAGNTTQGGNISVANTTAGGNVSISSVSTSGTVNSHTLSTNEMPSHYHSIHGNQYGNYYGWEANHSGIYGLPNRSYDQQGQNNRTSTNAGRTENAGGGGGHSHGFSGSSHTHNGSLSGTAHTHNATFSGSAHNHSISVSNLDMQAEYLDVIIAEKD